jgi:transposase
MIQITPQTKIFVAVEPVDFRKGIDGLVQYCKNEFEAKPFEGALFVFRNRRKTSVKLIVYDGQGFWLFQKRLSEGKFRYWPSDENGLSPMMAHELVILLRAGNPMEVRVAPDWRKL